MIVLGVDPGTTTTGYAVIEASEERVRCVAVGTLSPQKSLPFQEKLRQIYDSMTEILTKYEPDEMAVEDVFVKSNARVALRMGHVRGVVLLAGAASGIRIGEYSPREIKQAIVGRGSASKEQVKFMVSALLNLDNPPGQDEADALAVALCHLNRLRASEDSPVDIIHKRYSC